MCAHTRTHTPGPAPPSSPSGSEVRAQSQALGQGGLAGLGLRAPCAPSHGAPPPGSASGHRLLGAPEPVNCGTSNSHLTSGTIRVPGRLNPRERPGGRCGRRSFSGQPGADQGGVAGVLRGAPTPPAGIEACALIQLVLPPTLRPRRGSSPQPCRVFRQCSGHCPPTPASPMESQGQECAAIRARAASPAELHKAGRPGTPHRSPAASWEQPAGSTRSGEYSPAPAGPPRARPGAGPSPCSRRAGEPARTCPGLPPQALPATPWKLGLNFRWRVSQPSTRFLKGSVTPKAEKGHFPLCTERSPFLRPRPSPRGSIRHSGRLQLQQL